jgi:hypothetical protein
LHFCFAILCLAISSIALQIAKNTEIAAKKKKQYRAGAF